MSWESRPCPTASGLAFEIGRPKRRITPARWRRLRWRTRSAARSRRPTAGRTCSSAGAGSWMTGPATWPARVKGRRPQQRSMAFPPGITVVRATSPQGGQGAAILAATFALPRAAPAEKNGGSLSPPAPLLCGAPLRRARGGHARCSLASLFRRRRGQSVLSPV